ncbi:MAG: hypothetical protein H7X88_09130 [Gloeobacteraceae cyanobacterium ES-bin-316]|nr:hypothetical protein [Ferruginibacter sp.]
MKILISLFLYLVSPRIFCQDTFIKFVSKSSVQWAAQATDTFHFKTPNLSLLLRERFNKGDIKVGITEPAALGKVEYVPSKEAILERIAPNRVKQIVDEEGNITGTAIDAENPLFSTTYFDSLVNDLVEIPQVMYIESGKLKTYTAWVSPKYAVFTSWGQRLGISNAFSTAFNTSRSFSSKQFKNSILLGRSAAQLKLDSTGQLQMIKQLYAQNLLQALWPWLHTKHYQIIRLDSAVTIPFEKLNMSLLNNQILNIPKYDEEGNISNRTVNLSAQPLDPSAFTKLEIVQDWFYYEKGNKVFSRIQHLVLYAYKYKNNQVEAQATPVLKIMLK